MTLTEALNAVFRDNERIHRTSWKTRDVYCALEGGQLCIWGVPADGKWHPWVVTEADYFANDWEALND